VTRRKTPIPNVVSTFGRTHFDDAGAARMVDVGANPESERVAIASGVVTMEIETANASLRDG
jgi:cyclic pyranopterin phosphate synthase